MQLTVKLSNFSNKTGAKRLPSVFCFFAFLTTILGCSDFFEPVESTPTPTEYEYNYWLLNQQYLFEEELSGLDPEGDSVQTLYNQLTDPFTRYVAPSKSEAATISMNTSIVQGDVGMEYYIGTTEYPLYIYRVYPEGPAGRANVPRYGNILEINGVKLNSTNAYAVYDSVLIRNKDVTLTIAYKQDTLSYDLTKEDVYAPTVFLDTLLGTEFIYISEFKLSTADRTGGTYGELKSLLDTLPRDNTPRVIDLRNNPGGHVNQCISMADLFVKEGPLSTRSWRSITSNGNSTTKTLTVNATAGDAGEDRPFILLVNKSSASCSEIFTSAVAEGADIPVVGTYTYGKGIGQSTWNTVAGGLSIITNLKFLTPKDNSYHKTGIKPDYPCDSLATAQCAIDALEKIYGSSALKKSILGNFKEPQVITRKKASLLGAFQNL